MDRGRSVAELLREAGLRPKKALGQNFLVDDSALRRVAEAAELSPTDGVLEIGAGVGTLTRVLAEQARRVLAVEIDRALLPILDRELAGCPNVEVVPGDIMNLNIGDLARRLAGPDADVYKAIGNIPYYITSAVIRRLLEAEIRPVNLVLTVQNEVARRIVATPGDMSVLSVSVQLYGRAEIIHRIPAGAFYPAPKVDSAVVRVDLAGGPTVEVEDVDWFFRVVKAGFSARRKQLHNSLTHALHSPAAQVTAALAQAEVDPSRRAETLSLNEWARLARELRPGKE